LACSQFHGIHLPGSARTASGFLATASMQSKGFTPFARKVSITVMNLSPTSAPLCVLWCKLFLWCRSQPWVRSLRASAVTTSGTSPPEGRRTYHRPYSPDRLRGT